MPVRGYRSISVREEVYSKLIDIASLEGWGTVAEVVERLVELYYSTFDHRSGVINLISRLMFHGKMPGEVVETIRYGGGHPLVYLTYEVQSIKESINGIKITKIKIIPIIALNPKSITIAYRTGQGININALLKDLEDAFKDIDKAINKYFNKKEYVAKIIEKLNKFNVIIVKEPIYKVQVPNEHIKLFKKY